ncbi:IS3 family transposase [Caldalkalibacillus thermarum TA2.A1]|uniref:IS3 family transposase n=1 Tax=Caldalkalibacillus thermarum (strain TA2.A1) TaxID=986075 RepID=A0A8X8ICU9_CALTT|nr:IS3 family transposase [Caldalkalibacillus thermarum TA2.A1]QZT35429.1 IS3 family transposase [Caldalkalibacillus thermarum TA2.A1]
MKKEKPSLAEKIEVADKWIRKGYPIRTVLKIIGIARSTYYYRKYYRVKEKTVSEGRPAPGYSYNHKGIKVSDEQIKAWLLDLVAHEGQSYGYHKLTMVLRRQCQLIINKKKVYRLCKELGILRPQREKQNKPPKRVARNKVITDSNQLWETDIKYGFIEGEQRFFFLLSYIDVYDRTVIDFHIGLSCQAEDAVRALQRALLKRQLFNREHELIIRSDNGPQYISQRFHQGCATLKVEHERIPPKMPNMNAHIEAFHRILQDECLDRMVFDTYQEAYKAVTEFIRFYNKQRIHSSIHYLAPETFYEQNRRGLIPIQEVRV